jgi:biotin synthase
MRTEGWKQRIEASAGPYRRLARKSLSGEPLSRDEARSVLQVTQDQLPELLSAAYQVRRAHFDRRVKICVLVNARSGLCPEDCAYCSQADGAKTDIERYSLLPQDEIVARARAAAAAGAKRFCIVCAGRGPSDEDVEHIAGAVRTITAELPVEICCSLGLMTRAQAERLRQAGAGWINHNLNTGRRHYGNICTTHTYDDRVQTLDNVRAAGLATCSGGIVGMGESDDDLIDLIEHLRALDIDSIPINFLIAFDGTPLAGAPALSPVKGLAVLCLARLMNPAKEVRMAAGREGRLAAQQWLTLYPANSLFVDGYLTTGGQAHAAARQMIEAAGFEVEGGTLPAAMEV